MEKQKESMLRTALIRRSATGRLLFTILFLFAFIGGAKAEVTQTIALYSGWNWFSTNVDITLDDLKNALTDAIGNSNDIEIYSQNNGNTKYDHNRGRWRGQLNSLDVAQMYMIKVQEACEMTLEGIPIDPAEHPVDISSDVDNWIGYPFSEGMSVNDAFNDFAVEGDYIMSHTAFAVYTGGQWRGPLTALEPGKGYIYHSADDYDRVFVFPPQE